ALGLGEAARIGAQRVVADGADEQRRHALAMAGDGLVEALAAGPGVEPVRPARLAGHGKAVHQPGVVLDVAAHHGDGVAHAAPRLLSTPAMVAVMNVASEPPSTARRPNRARSARRSGAMPPMPPIWIAIEEKLAKPHSA